jgi:hypothetical protein
MAEIQLRQSETDRDRLPDVCIACGQPATSFIRKTFAWHPPWVIVIILAGLLPYVIVALILTKRMTVEAPVCDKHCGYWWKRQMLMWLPLLAVIVAFTGGMIIASNAGAPPGQNELTGFVCAGSAILFLAWLIVAAIVQSMMIRPTEITDRSIRLKRVHEGFVDAFDQLRGGRNRDFDRDDDDDVEDYDERMRQRRERRAKERSGYDDDRRESFRAERDPDEPPDERIRPRD